MLKNMKYTKPEVDVVDYLLDKIIKECKNKFFHLFIYRYVYDIKFTNIIIIEKVILITSHDCLQFKSEHYGLSEKNQRCEIE